MRAPVFLTGGTGLVGSHVAERLRARGQEVRALCRPGGDTAHLRALGCDVVHGDLAAADAALESALRGCGSLVHAAAVIYADLPWTRVREVNVGGTERVLRSAARAGVGRAVYLSSVAVYGDPQGGVVDEASDATRALRTWELYARSKREAEERVGALSDELRLPVALLRPSAIYGERDRLFTPKLARAFRLPVQFVLGDGRNPIPAVYAGNVAHAVVTALDARPAAGARTYDLGADHPVTQPQLLAALAEALGLPFRPVPLPAALARRVADAGEALGVRIPGARQLPLGRAARLATVANPYGSRRLREELGWSPPFTLGEALGRTAAWVAEHRQTFGL